MNAPQPAAPAADPRFDAARVIRAPRGSHLSCKSWLAEAAYRMLQNNLDPEVAEDPQRLVVYGGIGRAARDWACFDAILAALRALEDDESLLIQSGKPVGVFKTHPDAPRVLLANSNLVPRWADWEHFDELDRRGLMMYGQMTAGSWIYIGTQGIVQGTYETFAEAGRQHYGSGGAANPWRGRWILSAGLGGMGGAQPLAASFRRCATSLMIECQQSRIDFRLRTRYLDVQARDLDHALELIRRHNRGWRGPCRSAWRATRRNFCPNSCAAPRPEASSPISSPTRPQPTTWSTATCPRAGACQRWRAAQADPAQHASLREAAAQSCAVHVLAMLDFQAMGVPVVDYGNNIRQVAKDQGVAKTPSTSRASSRPTSGRCSAKARDRFRWVALSGDPEDIRKTDAKIKQLFPEQHARAPLARHGGAPGSPSRACRRASAGWASASATWRAWPSTRWCAPASSRRRS